MAIKPRTHSELLDPATGQVWQAKLSGSTLSTTTTTQGKSRETKKAFASAAVAQQEFFKKEWGLLKKGYLLRQAAATPGQPALHAFIGGGYSGCLTVEPAGDHLAVYQCGSLDLPDPHDFLLLMDRQGTIHERIRLPKVLPWHACYDAVSRSLLLDLDHFIYLYDLTTRTFRALTTKINQPASFAGLARNGSRAAYGSHPHVEVCDLKTGKVILARDVSSELIGGHSPQLCGALDESGKRLALCTRSGEIDLIDVATGSVVGQIQGDFEMIVQLDFAGDWLLAREQYGKWALLCFDVTTQKPIKPLSIGSGTLRHFCLNADATRIAVLMGPQVTVFDLSTGQQLCQFPVEHCIKSCQAAFWGDQLAIRTDYGCCSLYAV